MAMKQQPKPAQQPKPPSKPLRYFRHTETGLIHEADHNWADTMKNRADLIEVTKGVTTDDAETE